MSTARARAASRLRRPPLRRPCAARARLSWLVGLAAAASPPPAPGRAQGSPACEADPALAEAAALLLLEGGSLDGAAVERAVREAGASDVRVRARRVPDDAAGEARLDALAAEVARGADAPLVCGEARTAGLRLRLVTARGGRLDFGPDGGPAVALAPGFGQAELVVVDRAGEVARGPLDGSAAWLPEVERPWRRVQVLAVGPDGLRPVAERTGDASAPPSVWAGALPTTPAEAVDQVRAAAAAPGLRHNRLLARLAEAHAAHVCRSGRAAHALDGAGDPEARLARAGLRARVVGEAVARGAGLEAAIGALLRSPAHHAVLVDRRMSDVGAASHAQGEVTCVVVLLAAWPRPTG